VRKVLAQHFTRPGCGARTLVRGHADSLVSDWRTRARHFVTEVVDPYPLRVLAAVLGLPAETEEGCTFVSALGDAKSGSAGPSVTDEPPAPQRRSNSSQPFTNCDARMANPGADLISAMSPGRAKSGAAAERIGGILIQLAIAGNETTRGAAGLGMQYCSNTPAVGAGTADPTPFLLWLKRCCASGRLFSTPADRCRHRTAEFAR